MNLWINGEGKCGKKNPGRILTTGLMRLAWKRLPCNYLWYCLIFTFVMLLKEDRNWHFGTVTEFFSLVMFGIVFQSTDKTWVPERCIYRDIEKFSVVLIWGSKASWSVIWFPWRGYRQGCAYQRKEGASKEEELLPCQFCVSSKYCLNNIQTLFFATPAKVLSVLFHHVNAYWLMVEGTFHIQIV